MMVLHEQIDSLKTPCGTVHIIDEAGTRISFSLRKNPFDCDYEFESKNGVAKVIHTDTNYCIVGFLSFVAAGKRIQDRS